MNWGHPRRHLYMLEGEDFPRETTRWYTGEYIARKEIRQELGAHSKKPAILWLSPIECDPITKRKDMI